MRLKTAPFLFALAALSFLLVAMALPAGTRGSMAAISLGSGVVALVMMALASTLGARWKVVESAFGGLDRVYETHKWLGVWALVFASVHLVFKAGMEGWDTAAIIELPAFVVRLVRQLSFVALMVIVLLALNRRIPYRTWRWWHKLSGPLFLIVVLHWLSFKTPIVLLSPAGVWLAVASALGIAGAFYKLLLYPYVSSHAEYRVTDVEPGPSAVKLLMAPAGEGVRFDAGQFAFVSFNTPGLREPHPFTIASASGPGESVQFVIRALGDYTRRLVSEVSPGMTAEVHAPFGRFARPTLARREAWIAGGVGISPFIAWLDDADGRDFDRVTLFNFQTPGREFPASEEVAGMARRRGVEYVSMTTGVGTPEFQDRFEALAREAGIDGLQVCFCGPRGLLDEVRKAMARHHVPATNLRYEYFDFRYGASGRALRKKGGDAAQDQSSAALPGTLARPDERFERLCIPEAASASKHFPSRCRTCATAALGVAAPTHPAKSMAGDAGGTPPVRQFHHGLRGRLHFAPTLRVMQSGPSPSGSSSMRFVVLFLLSFLLSGCGYNQIQQKDEAVTAGWSEVLNQYQRRADLVPNLVATVKGYAAHEQQVLTDVTNARARVGQMNVNAEDAASLAEFQQAQGELSSALSRLLMVTENYPNLKADQSFRDLQVQLEGTENRITVARGRYIQLVQDYNTYIRSFPQNLVAMMFGYDRKPNFSVENEREIQRAPTVDFGAPAAPPAPPAPPVPQPAG